MILIQEPNGTTYITLLDMPAFPTHLQAQAEAVKAGGGVNEVEEFLADYGKLCQRLGIKWYKGGGEDRVQVKRMLAHHTPDILLRYADIFLNSELAAPLSPGGQRTDGPVYQHHMRLFAHHLPEVTRMRVVRSEVSGT